MAGRFQRRPARGTAPLRYYRSLPRNFWFRIDDSMKDFSNHFRELVKRQLPDDPRVLVPRGVQDLMILATWRLSSDALRPHKRSRMMRIVISQEALKIYARGSDEMRLADDARFIAWFRRQLGGFDPNHDSPLGVEPPAVTWPVDTRILNDPKAGLVE
jgi:hypothetical protein